MNRFYLGLILFFFSSCNMNNGIYVYDEKVHNLLKDEKYIHYSGILQLDSLETLDYVLGNSKFDIIPVGEILDSTDTLIKILEKIKSSDFYGDLYITNVGNEIYFIKVPRVDTLRIAIHLLSDLINLKRISMGLEPLLFKRIHDYELEHFRKFETRIPDSIEFDSQVAFFLFKENINYNDTAILNGKYKYIYMIIERKGPILIYYRWLFKP